MSATMFRPGTVVEVTDQPGPVSAPTDTDALFAVGATTSGPAGKAVLIRSLDQYEAVFGERLPASPLYDSLETFLREGGSRAYVSRVVGSSGTTEASVQVDGAAAAAFEVRASSLGADGNRTSVLVAAQAPGFVLSVMRDGVLKEQSPNLPLDDMYAAAAAWADSSSAWITIWPLSNEVATDGTYQLAGGADGTLSDQDWVTALEAFPAALGPGQVAAPGCDVSAVHLGLLAHAMGYNRVALLDATDTADVSILRTQATSVRTSGDQDHYGGLFAPWAVIQGLAPGTTRQVPWSAIQAGIYARNEHAGVSPAQPGAGQQYGRSRTALALTQAFTDADRNELARSGVNTARGDLGLIESYGSRTVVDPQVFPQWRELGQVRLIMAIVAHAEAIAEAHLFAVLDGRRHEIAKFGGELTGMLIPYYEDGSLYGDTPQEAFRVDVGAAVNTEATIAAGELRAVIGLRCSHMAELVYVQIVKVETTQAL